MPRAQDHDEREMMGPEMNGARMNDPGTSKVDLRDRARANRLSLRVDHGRVRAGIEHFVRTRRSTGEIPQAAWVVTFAAMPGEPDLAGLDIAAGVGPIALTRTPDEGRRLSIHPIDGELETHRWGYRQPVASAPTIADDDVAVVLVPGLAFDRRGGRLGHGAGYYDRFLARLSPTVIRVGVSDGFILDEVPSDEHDVPMTHLATEAGVVPLPL